MYVLIDYDNFEKARPLEANKGLLYFADVLINAVTSLGECNYSRIKIRLYGGWYLSKKPTIKSQKISTEIGKCFPTVLNIKDINGKVVKVNLSMELAYSLLELPQRQFINTLRIRDLEVTAKCKHPIVKGCARADCGMIDFYNIFKTRKCPQGDCQIELDGLLEKTEQKLVDTMLSLDLLYAGQVLSNTLVIVSSDDDFLPAIASVINKGKKVIHVHTHPSGNIGDDYKRFFGSFYVEVHL